MPTRRPDILPRRVGVAVIGGGPAGAVAAFEAAAGLARAGYVPSEENFVPVAIIEAKTRPGEPCHCAEWVPSLLAREVGLPAEVRRSAAEGLTTRFAGFEELAKVSGYVIDRPAWERGLLEKAVQAGARLLSGTRLSGIEGKKLHLSGPFGKAEMEAGLVIAADGALSRTVAALGLERLAGVRGLQVEVDLKTDLPAGLTAFRPELFGYLWLFPKGRTANLGLGGEVLGQAPLKIMLEQWWAELADEGLVGKKVFRRGGGYIPAQGPRGELVLERGGLTSLLTGDAAGLTHPLTGAGIPQAVNSGRAAGRAAAGWLAGQGGALSEFENEVKSLYRGYLSRGAKKRAQARQMWTQDFEAAVKVYWPLLPKAKKRRAA